LFFARKHKKKPYILSPIELWRRWAWFYPGILDSKDLNDFFGSLTRHAISNCNEEFIGIECVKCKNLAVKEDVCEAHLGIILGLAEAKFRRKYLCKKQLQGTVCIISLEPAA
jgi:hypothetical protein